MNRFRLGARLFTGLAILTGIAVAAAPDRSVFTGNWTLDAGKSQIADARAMTLNIEMTGDVMKFTSVAKKSDATATSKFSCDTGSGADCVFDESGHKSKVSVYFSGPAVLNLCKTEGPQGDVVTQWKVEVSSDAKVLTATLSHVEPAAKDEVLVFTKP